MSDDQAWADATDTSGDTSTDPTDTTDDTSSDPTDTTDDTSSESSDVPGDQQDVKGEPELDLSQAQVGQPPEEALAFNDFETSWTEGVA
jgi:hypothetical protein